MSRRNELVSYLHRIARPEVAADVPDAALLDRFQLTREEAAFAELVRRHGSVVYSVCSRVLGNTADAEDAFQAAFILLVRQIASIDRRRPLAGWLYTVAYRAALKARLKRKQLNQLEGQAPPMAPTEQTDELDRRELRDVLDEELQRLPALERDLLILCDIQGRTQTEAAAALNRPLGSVSRLLSSAREQLRVRLTRRGVGVPTAALAALLANEGLAAVPPGLSTAAVRAALEPAAGASPAAVEIARQVARDALAGRATTAAAGLFAVAALAGTAALAFYGVPLGIPEPSARIAAPVPNLRGPKTVRVSEPVFRHGAAVTALAVSPDGQSVASAGADRILRVWDCETGRELLRFNAPPEGVASLAFAPDRDELLIEDARVGLAIYFLDSGRRRKNHLGQCAGVEALAYSADGKKLATAGRDGKVIWLDLTVPQATQRPRDWEQQELAAKFVLRHFCPPDPAARARHGRAVAFTADGATVYAIDRTLNLTRLEVPSGRVETAKLKLDPKARPSLPATTVAIAPGATWAAWGNGDERVGLAQLPSGPARFIDGHGAAVMALAFAPEGRALASVDADGRLIHTTLPETGGEFESRTADFRFRAAVLAVSPDGKRVYGAGANGEVHCWEISSLEPVRQSGK